MHIYSIVLYTIQYSVVCIQWHIHIHYVCVCVYIISFCIPIKSEKQNDVYRPRNPPLNETHISGLICLTSFEVT